MERLAIVAIERKAYGYVCLPFVVETERAPMYFTVEYATIEMANSGRLPMTEAEREVVKALSMLTDNALWHRFGKNKSLRDFNNKLDPGILKNFILPFIDRTLNSVLPLIIENDILFFHKAAGFNNMYETDIVKWYKRPSRPKFFFTLDSQGVLRYSLSITDRESNGDITETTMTGKKVAELSGNPSVILVNNVGHYFANIETKKFTPFLEKRFIAIQPQSVEMYMNSFVKKCVRDYYVIAKGFGLMKREETMIPVLRIEQGVEGWGFRLLFAYANEKYAYQDEGRTVELEKKDGSYTFYTYVRDRAEEDRIAAQLLEIGLRHTGRGYMECDVISSRDTSARFVMWLNEKSQILSALGIKSEVDDSREFYTGMADLRVDMTEGQDWFDINAVVVLDDCEIPFYRLRDNILHGQQEYVLENGKVFIIPEEWFASWSDLLQFSRIEKGQIRVGSMHKMLIPGEYRIDSDEDAGIEKLSTTERQGVINATLREYQGEGFRWLNTLYENKKGGILADDMGLGKTLQVIALLSHVFATSEKSDGEGMDLFGTFNDTATPPALIVMPVSLIHNWMSEIAKFAPHLRVYNNSGKSRIKSQQIGKVLRHYHVVVISYGLLRNDIEFLKNYEFSYLILDESQCVKNPSSIIYRAVTAIKASHKLTVSGTPIENSLGDLWAQMNIVNKGLLGSFNFFRSYFELPIERYNDDAKRERLQKIISPYILRRTKEMVAKELPPVTEQVIYCEMTDDQRKVYESEKSGCRNEILRLADHTTAKDTFMALKALTRLRLIANHPRLAQPDYEGRSGKSEQILEQVSNIVSEGHKVLVFSSFVKDLEMFASEFARVNIGYVMLTGSTSNRASVIEQFNNDKSKSVFLISLKAGGVGLNLTTADYVLLLNPWWNPQAEQQAIDRAHRIGQTKNVFVYRFITTGTIEEKIARLQEKKLTLAGTFINDNCNSLTNLTVDEIKELVDE